MNFSRQLTIDDMLNAIIMPSDKNFFACEVKENEKEVCVSVKIKNVYKHEVSMSYNNGYIYINSFSKEDNFLYDKGIYVGNIINKSIKMDIKKDFIYITALKKKNG